MSNGLLKASTAGGMLLWGVVAAVDDGYAGAFSQALFFIAIPLAIIISFIAAAVLFTFWLLFPSTKKWLLIFNAFVFIFSLLFFSTILLISHPSLGLNAAFAALINSVWLSTMAIMISLAGVEEHNKSFKADAAPPAQKSEAGGAR